MLIPSMTDTYSGVIEQLAASYVDDLINLTINKLKPEKRDHSALVEGYLERLYEQVLSEFNMDIKYYKISNDKRNKSEYKTSFGEFSLRGDLLNPDERDHYLDLAGKYIGTIYQDCINSK